MGDTGAAKLSPDRQKYNRRNLGEQSRGHSSPHVGGKLMVDEPAFALSGTKTGDIDVVLSYDIVRLFSEGLYESPNKAIEELVSNSFDAGAKRTYVVMSPDLNTQDATIAVVDDGEGMDGRGLRRHWRIGDSNKRKIRKLPLGRKQIGKFGIGKLSTYVLANRLTHISKYKSKYYSATMDYGGIDKHPGSGIVSKESIKIPLRELDAEQAKVAVDLWAKHANFNTDDVPLFGDKSPESWTISIMSELKPKVQEIEPGRLRWILRTALPLHPNFGIWLNGEKLESSKSNRHPAKTWIIGKDITELPRPGLQNTKVSVDKKLPKTSEHRFGLVVPGLGRITGYVEGYKDPLTGNKSDEFGRSYGFFVFIRERLLYPGDDHFGIPSNILRHGTLSRFRLLIHMDELDHELRSSRDGISEGPRLEIARNVLQGIFNKVRHVIETYDLEEESGTKLARRIATSPTGLSRGPIVELSRAVAESKEKSRYLIIPNHASPEKRETFLADLNQRAQQAESFVTGVDFDYDGTSRDGIVKFDTKSGVLLLNGLHPFVATFDKEFGNRNMDQPLKLFAMAEVLAEAHLYSIGIKSENIDEFLLTRDQLLRDLANESGRLSASSVANDLSNARNNPDRLEEAVCNAFTILGFDTRRIGKKGEPDGVAIAHLSPDDEGNPCGYKVSLEAKSKEDPEGKINAQSVDISAVIRHRKKHECDHAVVVCQKFTTEKGSDSALGQSIDDDREKTLAKKEPRTITLIELDDLENLVMLCPKKRLQLPKIRELFKCRLPDESKAWVESTRAINIEKPRYREIIETIELLQKKSRRAAVKYAALHNELQHLDPPIDYETDEEVTAVCKAMALIAPNSIRITPEKVVLEQSARNVLGEIMDLMRDDISDGPEVS